MLVTGTAHLWIQPWWGSTKRGPSQKEEGVGVVARKKRQVHLWRSHLLFISQKPEILFGRWIYLRRVKNEKINYLINYLNALCLVDKIFQDMISTAENHRIVPGSTGTDLWAHFQCQDNESENLLKQTNNNNKNFPRSLSCSFKVPSFLFIPSLFPSAQYS